MKTLKTLTSTLTIAALLSLGVSSTKAALGGATVVGTTTAFSTINITLTVTTNGATSEKNGVTTWHIGKAKATNKTLLHIFSDWSTNDTSGWSAAGARLEYDWDANQLIVADKTGTNVLFYAGDGVNNGTVTAFFNIEWFYEDGPYTETDGPNLETYKEATTAYFELSYDDTSDASTQNDLFSYSANTVNYHETTKWTESESFKINYSGVTFQNEDESQVSGTITTSGHGAGSNPYLD
jgi:hypothetical protein